MNDKPLDPNGIRKWAVGVNNRLDRLEAPLTFDGFPIRIRTEGPLTEAQLVAKMVRNGATPESASKDAHAIFNRLVA